MPLNEKSTLYEIQNVLYNRAIMKMGGVSLNCMKCGREISEGVFCTECLEEMDRYPIKPGTVVNLPRRKAETAAKKTHTRRRVLPSLEEQNRALRKQLRRMLLVMLILILLLGVSGYFAVIHLLESDAVFLPGQNYSAVTNDSLDEWD